MLARLRALNKRTLLKRLVQIGLALFAAVLILPLLGAVIQCRMWAPKSAEDFPPAVPAAEPAGLPGYARPEDQTYLTLPEWYIVFNADEYAAYLADRRPSRFPYGRAIAQYWSTNYAVCRETRDAYPFNGEYQVMLAIIGVSFTAETAVRGAYEKTIGRLFEGFGRPAPTAEERFAHEVAVEYGAFIHTIPWFKFPFGEKLAALWREVPWWGPRPLRKWERRLALTAEYAVKAGYGALLNAARDQVFGELILETQMWVDHYDPERIDGEPEVAVVAELDHGEAIITMPRYEPVTQITPRLAAAGLTFKEIAGNDDIVLTVFSPAGRTYRLPGRVLLALPYLSDPAQVRLVVAVPVGQLHEVLLGLPAAGMTLEHIFDY